MTVYRGRQLDSFAEGTKGLFAAKADRLDNVMTPLCAGGMTIEAEFFIHRGGKNGTLQSSCHHRRSQKKSLKEKLIQPQARSQLFSKSRCRQPMGGIFYVFPFADNIASYGGQSAPRIFN